MGEVRFTVRDATLADVPGAAALGAALVQFHHGLDPQRFAILSERLEAGYRWFLEGRIKDSRAVVLVADDSRGFWLNAYVSEKDAPLVGVGQPARIRMLAGPRRYIDAEVTQIGEHTQSQDVGVTGGTQSVQGESVWVKIRPKETLPPGLKHGMTARAVIKIR